MVAVRNVCLRKERKERGWKIDHTMMRRWRFENMSIRVKYMSKIRKNGRVR